MRIEDDERDKRNERRVRVIYYLIENRGIMWGFLDNFIILLISLFESKKYT